MVRDKANGSETPKFQLLTGRPVSFALIEMRSHARHPPASNERDYGNYVHVLMT